MPRKHDVSGHDGSGTAVKIESDADAAERLAGKVATLAARAGSNLGRETAHIAVSKTANASSQPSVSSASLVNTVIQAAADVVIAANSAADAATSLANNAADAAAAASSAAAHAASTPAGEAMSTANRAAEQNFYAANKAADAAANNAGKVEEQARSAEAAASRLQHLNK